MGAWGCPGRRPRSGLCRRLSRGSHMASGGPSLTTQVRLRDPGHLVLPARTRSPLPLTRSLQPGQSDANSPIEKAGGDRGQQRPARCRWEASARRGSCQKQQDCPPRLSSGWGVPCASHSLNTQGEPLGLPWRWAPGWTRQAHFQATAEDRINWLVRNQGSAGRVQTANNVVIIIIVTTDSSCARCHTVDQALCTFSLV